MPPDLSIPLSLDSQMNIATGPPRVAQPTYWWLQVMGRLKPGVTAAQVQGNLEGVFQHTARTGLDAYLNRSRTRSARRQSTGTGRKCRGCSSNPARRGIYDVERQRLRSITILSVVVVLVLLIVCANVANLLLSRATVAAEGTVGPPLAGCDAWEADPPAADGEPAACVDGRCARNTGRATGANSCCRDLPGQATPLRLARCLRS